MRGASVDVTCDVCGRTVPRKQAKQLRCGARSCKRRATYLRERSKPGFAERNRATAAAWYTRNRDAHRRNVAVRATLITGANGRWFVTPHAIERFCQGVGWEVGRRYEDALATLIDESRGAHRVKLLPSGAELWRGPKPRRLRYIVQPGEGSLPALVTVLGSHDRP